MRSLRCAAPAERAEPTPAPGCRLIVRSGVCVAFLATIPVFVAGLPSRAGAWASPEDEKASREMSVYLVQCEGLGKLLAGGPPETALAALRTYERADEVRLRTHAQVLLYEHAARFGLGDRERERLRPILRAAAENRKAPATARDEALRVLLTSTWSGRDDWYAAQLGDATLRAPTDGSAMYSPLGWTLETDPGRWVPWLIPKLATKGVVRSNVAHILAQLADRDSSNKKPPRRDVAIALLPWLADRKWADGVNYHTSPRAEYISSLERLELPEAIPGLIHVVETETDYVGARAAGALEHFRDPRALPALRKALKAHLGVEWEREAFLSAIRACGGQKPLSAVAALQAYAHAAATPDGMELIRYGDIDSRRSPDATLALGIHLAHEPDIDDETAAQVIASVRRTRPPAVAFALEAPLFAWSAPAARRHVVARLADRDLDDRLLRIALNGRNVLAASVGPELRALLARGGTGAGRAAALLDDRDAIVRVLRGNDVPAILGLFHACVVSDRRGLDRTVDWHVFVRDGKGGPIALVVADVGPLLARPEADVAAVARAWLTHEGGPIAKAWLAANGKLANPPAAEAHAYNIAGVAPGVKRAAVEKAGPNAPRAAYGPHDDVIVVTGPALRDGAREIVGSSAHAADVRDLLGRPDLAYGDHVFATVGGFFWHYRRAGVVIVFAFTDDRSELGDAAPLFQVQLVDPATWDTKHVRKQDR